MPQIDLPPPGVTQAMSSDPSQIYFQKRPPAPSSSEAAAMAAMGTQYLKGKDSISSSVDPSSAIGLSFLSGAQTPAPPPSPTPPSSSVLGGTSPVDTISSGAPTGRANPWFGANPMVAFMIAFMSATRSAMMAQLMDGITVVKQMGMNMALAQDSYNTDIAIGELNKQKDLNDAAGDIAAGVMSICSAAFTAVSLGISMVKFKDPVKPSDPTVSTDGEGGADDAAIDKGMEENENPLYGAASEDVSTASSAARAEDASAAAANTNAATEDATKAGQTTAARPSPTTETAGAQDETASKTDDANATAEAASDENNNLAVEAQQDEEGTASAQTSSASTRDQVEDRQAAQNPSDAKAAEAQKAKASYKEDLKMAQKNRQEFMSTANNLGPPIFQGMGQIVQGAMKLKDAQIDGELGQLNGIKDMIQGWQRNSQQIQGSASDDYKSQTDEVSQLIQTLQQLIDQNFKAFTINPKG